MNDDGFADRLRAAEGQVAPDPRFVDRLYLELASELQLPSAQGRVATRERQRARPRLSLLAAALLLVALALAAAIIGGQMLLRPSVVIWSGFKGDAARRGEGTDGPRGAPVLRWRYQANGAVPDNVSVAGDLAYASSDDGVLHALDIMTGDERWSFVAEQPPLRGPVIDGGVVFVFDGIGVLHAVDATTGDERWQSAEPVAGPSSPTVGDGAVYAGSAAGALVAIDVTNGTQRWRTPISTTGAAHAPAFSGGRVFVAGERGDVVAVDAAAGSVVWRFDAEGLDAGTVVVADGIALVGGTDASGAGMLWALDAATGLESWRIDQPLGNPSVSDGIAYSGSAGLGVFAIDTDTGDLRWTFPVDGDARPLAVAEGVVYVPADAEHRVYALDAATGAELWHFDVDAGIWCCIGVARGAVYVGTELGGIYAIAGSEDALAPKD